MRNTTINVGPLLVTMSLLFSAYYALAAVTPELPVPVQQALASVPSSAPLAFLCQAEESK